jgi:hypothetical protein
VMVVIYTREEVENMTPMEPPNMKLIGHSKEENVERETPTR